jgi:hypothetical protein
LGRVFRVATRGGGVLIRADPGCDRKRRAHVPWMPPADAIEAIGTLADARARPVGGRGEGKVTFRWRVEARFVLRHRGVGRGVAARREPRDLFRRRPLAVSARAGKDGALGVGRTSRARTLAGTSGDTRYVS